MKTVLSKEKRNKERIERAIRDAIKRRDGRDTDAANQAIGQLCGANPLINDPDEDLPIFIGDIGDYGVEPIHEDISVKCFDGLEPTTLEWIWPGRIPCGKVVLFSGDPGTGKSMATIDIAARITKGLPWPDATESAPFGEVLLVSDEDDPEDTVLPRLMAAGADLAKVHSLTMRTSGVERTLNLAEDIKPLEEVLTTNSNIRAIILDPINNYVGKLDDRADIRVREVMMPLVRMARDFRLSVICVKHLNKDASQSASYRTSGAGWVGVARQMWMFAPDPTCKGQFVMVSGKTNLGPSVKGLAYRIKRREGDLQAHIEWAGSTEVTADEALASTRGPGRPSEGKLEEAKTLLRKILGSSRRGAAFDDIKKEAAAAGIKDRTLDRAKTTLKVKSERNAERNYIWVLPPDSPED